MLESFSTVGQGSSLLSHSHIDASSQRTYIFKMLPLTTLILLIQPLLTDYYMLLFHSLEFDIEFNIINSSQYLGIASASVTFGVPL